MSYDDELMRDFIEEAVNHLAHVERDLLQIESQGSEIDLELVNQLFRGIHSIKGAAGFLGLGAVQSLAHRLENLLNGIRSEEFVPDKPTIDVLLASADQLRILVEAPEASEDVDITAHLDALDDIARRHQTDGGEHALDDPTDSETAIQDVLPDVEVRSPVQDQFDQATKNDPWSESAARGGPRNGSAADANIRVAVGTLDQLMNLAGELVLSRNQLLQMLGDTQNIGFEAVASRIDQVTSELQEAIMQTRMQPIGTVFNRFRRVVRDLSGKLGKQCDLSISGEEVELDKTIIEAIADPLTHLVRNAIDHGIEAPEARVAQGKKRCGVLHLRAFHQAGKVIIRIEDDGRGINAHALKEKAVAKAFLAPERAADMPEREAVRLIFHPGFSTAETVTDVSGRGVGMDVVKTNIEKLGGSVELETEVGVGTKITVTLPLTLAIIPCLLVRAGRERYAIPQANIAELVRVRPAEVATRIGRVKNAEVLRLRGSLLSLVRLSQVVEAEAEDRAEDAVGDMPDNAEHYERAWNIIVVESGRVRYGLIVDGLFDSEEIVVKPLGRHLNACVCLAGATVLGDGHVAMILDIPGIMMHAKLERSDEEPQSHTDQDCSVADVDEQWALLFTNDPKEQFAIPMGLISRIERIRSEQIDHVAGQELLQYRGVSLPLLSLERCINALPRAEQTRLYVAVFNMGQREVGLIVPDIVDIRIVPSEIDSMTLSERGVMGSLVVDGHTVRMIDLFELAEVAHPDWVNTARVHGNDQGGPTILLAEDSNFFRTHVAGYLEEHGYQVLPCEDGAVAWEKIRSDTDSIDLVITDVQMPNLDGFGLCRKIKGSTTTAHLPVIALTSLAGDEDVRRGQDCGIDEYQVKMDRDNLLRAVGRLLGNRPGLAGGTHDVAVQECHA